VQTPQVFDFELLLAAHRRWPADVTDDAMLVEALGSKVKIFLGSPRNIKVTGPDDLLLVQALLDRENVPSSSRDG
jgi:2-C-methyl-D-erythritol 4-phosphate cytidylyltransferase